METFVPGIEIRLAFREDLWQVRELALLIFPFTYREIVEPEQIDYMMDMFYQPDNLVRQLESGQTFLIIYLEERPAGFASYTRLNEEGIFKLNKIYLDNRLQGKGLGRILLNNLISRVKAAGGSALQLNVNRYNKAVGFYKAMGFKILKEELLDIGNGYFMDDYVLVLSLTPNA
jgi:ribosomal protein S18 acetylase RimI-like enzyme